MSIEAMKQVIELYDKHCYNNDYGGIEFNNKHGYKFIEAIEALRTAIHQAEVQQPANAACKSVQKRLEAQQPATGKPVWCVATGERVNGEETFTHHDAYVPLADCFPLYTHQAPSVPDDMVRDAERWRTFLATRPSNTHEVVNAAIDAAMLAAK